MVFQNPCGDPAIGVHQGVTGIVAELGEPVSQSSRSGVSAMRDAEIRPVIPVPLLRGWAGKTQGECKDQAFLYATFSTHTSDPGTRSVRRAAGQPTRRWVNLIYHVRPTGLEVE